MTTETTLPKFVAYQGYRHEVISRNDGSVHLYQSPRPRWGRHGLIRATAEQVLKLETWAAYKARVAAQIDRGTCQICGREIGSKNGRIAHHGYERPQYGYQTASCVGARHKPFEQSRDRLAWWIAELALIRKSQIARLKDEEALDLDSVEPVNRIARAHQRKLTIERLRASIASIPGEIKRQQERYDDWKMKD